jgi:hypothetical protein
MMMQRARFILLILEQNYFPDDGFFEKKKSSFLPESVEMESVAFNECTRISFHCQHLKSGGQF